MAASWWRERRALRAAARDLTEEFARLNVEGVGFRVRAHGRGSLELLVWPEGGLDNFVVSTGGLASIGKARDELRYIVARYAVGERPPFG